jgi:lipoprotein signal peptidase
MNSFIIGIVCVVGIGCSSLGEIAVGTIGGALGNMLDRRIEDKLGNDAALSDEKLDGKLNKKGDWNDI